MKDAWRTLDRSTSAVSSLVLRAKKEKWEAKERERLRQRNVLLRELEDALLATRETDMQDLKLQGLRPSDEVEIKAIIESTSKSKIEELYNLVAMADPKNLQRRVNISFMLFLEVCIQPADCSYRRSQIILSTAFPLQ